MSDLRLRIVHAQAHYSASRFHDNGVDLNVSHAEFAELIDAVKADAREQGWDAVVDALERDLTVDDGFMIQLCEELRDANPYRDQEEVQ